jgi:hypothetical protein
MSCSSVNIKGTGNGTHTTPAGPPLLVANLDPIRNECYTKESTSVIYPRKYIGDAVEERALVRLHKFPGPNPDGCGSDNSTLLELLKRSPDGAAASKVRIVGASTLPPSSSPVSISPLPPVPSSPESCLITPSASRLSSFTTQKAGPPPCSYSRGIQQVPSAPALGSPPDPLWAVSSAQRGCYYWEKEHSAI